MDKIKRVLKDFILPNYTEFSLFIMSFSFIGLMLINNELAKEVIKLILSGENILVYIGAAVFTAGTIISSINIFTNRQKYQHEKALMIFFTILTNIVTGIGIWMYMIYNGFTWLFVFPALNLLNAGAMIFMFKFGIVNERKDFDENTTLTNIVLGVILVSAIIYLTNNILNLHWAIIFSICITYAGLIDDIIKLFQK